MYRLVLTVVDDSVFASGQDDPRIVKSVEVGSVYHKRDLAEKFAVRAAEIVNVSEAKITGKRRG